MTVEEYQSKLQAIESEYRAAKKQLAIDFAASKIKYKKGDIIRCHGTTIRVEKFGAYSSFGFPRPSYTGPELRKDLQPKKNGDYQTIYGNDNVELIKEEG